MELGPHKLSAQCAQVEKWVVTATRIPCGGFLKRQNGPNKNTNGQCFVSR